jgi:hypothetical protein
MYLLYTFARSLEYYIELCLIRRLNICNAHAFTTVEDNGATVKNAKSRVCYILFMVQLITLTEAQSIQRLMVERVVKTNWKG